MNNDIQTDSDKAVGSGDLLDVSITVAPSKHGVIGAGLYLSKISHPRLHPMSCQSLFPNYLTNIYEINRLESQQTHRLEPWLAPSTLLDNLGSLASVSPIMGQTNN